MRTLLLALAATLALASCGKKGNPEPPGPASEIIFPKTYPSR
jgi:predicted small lipoprotein YifL